MSYSIILNPVMSNFEKIDQPYYSLSNSSKTKTVHRTSLWPLMHTSSPLSPVYLKSLGTSDNCSACGHYSPCTYYLYCCHLASSQRLGMAFNTFYKIDRWSYFRHQLILLFGKKISKSESRGDKNWWNFSSRSLLT